MLVIIPHILCLSTQDIIFLIILVWRELMKNIKQRLRQFITANGGNTAEIARQMGLKETYLGSVLSKESKGLSATMIIGFAKAGFDVQWLLTGEENPFADCEKIIAELEENVKRQEDLINSLERILGREK